jgi:Fe-S cluster assembly protein SufD
MMMAEALDRRRTEAAGRLARTGLPTRRDEAWKYTDLRRIAGKRFETAEPETLVRPTRLPPGVSLRPLAEALGDAAIAARFAALPEGPIADLNGADATGGLVLTIAAGIAVDEPIRIDLANRAGGDGVAFHRRLFVDVGAHASATIVESHAGPDGAAYLATQVFDIEVGQGARLVHLRLQEEGRDATHLLSGVVRLAADAVYDGFTLSLGAGLARTETRLVFGGRGGDGRVTGAYLADGTRHVDTTTLIDHAVPDCRSREVFKGVLDDRGRGVFQGKILVRRGAQRTDGYQLSRALLLSGAAEIDTKPELEIYADDVKCSHGATVGEIDAAALFYLRSRGIGEAEARSILVEGFLSEALDEIADPALREDFVSHVARRLAARRSEG